MIYTYEATDHTGAIIRGEFEASGKEGVMEYLLRKELIPVRVEGKESVKGGGKLSINLFQSITPLDRILLVRNLAVTIKAGVSIVEALDILSADATKVPIKEFLIRAKLNLQNGQPLSATFSAQKKVFPSIFSGMLKAGEASGKLDDTLRELGSYLTREYNLKKKVKSALTYPAILLAASTGVITLLLVFVLPRLTKTFKQSGADLPLLTRILVKMSEAVTYSYLLDIAVLGVLLAAGIYMKRTVWGRSMAVQFLFRVPVTREVIRKIALVRFTRTLGSLISSGLSIIESLELAAESVGNELYKSAIKKVVEQIKSGVPLSKALGNYPELFPHFLTSLIMVGERTGSVEYILKTFSDFYDSEVNYTLKSLTTFLEPVLLLCMGAIIGTIALSILMPIYQLVSKFR